MSFLELMLLFCISQPLTQNIKGQGKFRATIVLPFPFSSSLLINKLIVERIGRMYVPQEVK